MARCRPSGSPTRVGPLECSFCGVDGATSALVELRDKAYSQFHGYCCSPCEDLYVQFASGLTYTNRRGNRPWLVADPGTEHVLRAKPDPFGEVHAAIDGISSGITEVPPAAARIAALRLGVWGPQALVPCGSREEAVTAVSHMIAEDLQGCYAAARRYSSGRDHRRYTVSLFGNGCGVMLQQVTTEGDWLRQYCFPFDTDHAVHLYMNYDR